MANNKIFMSSPKPATISRSSSHATAVNTAGGKAYELAHKQALALIAATNTFNGTFYASAEENLALTKKIIEKLECDPQFIAKVAVYSRTVSYMKDMPAYLMVVLARIDPTLFRKLFNVVINDGKMLRTFCQIARSGQTGRKFNLSAGTCRSAIQNWFNSRTPEQIFRAYVGNNPSMRDILRMAHPKPASVEHEDLFGYITGKDIETLEHLPKIVSHYEKFKLGMTNEVPNVDFRLLDSIDFGDRETEAWSEIARNASWLTTVKNINTFARHGVFNNGSQFVQMLANRISDLELIKKSRSFPYQIMSAWKATLTNDTVPYAIRNALQDAMDLSTYNIPKIPGKIVIAVDSSGSMGSPIINAERGNRTGLGITCLEVAGLIASCLIKHNPDCTVYSFNSQPTLHRLNPRDTILTNAEKLSKGGGSTDCSCVIRELNNNGTQSDCIVFISDYESWLDSTVRYSSRHGNTEMQKEWDKYRANNKNCKLVCIDLTPRDNSQVKQRSNVLQVGGMSDSIFGVIASFIEHGFDENKWISIIEQTHI